MFTFGILVQTNEQILITVLENALFTWQAIQVEKRPFFAKCTDTTYPFYLDIFGCSYHQEICVTPKILFSLLPLKGLRTGLTP